MARRATKRRARRTASSSRPTIRRLTCPSPKSLPLEAVRLKNAATPARSCRRTDRWQAHLASKTSTGTDAGRSCIRAINATARLSEQERHARRAQRAYRAALGGIPGPSPDRADAARKLTKRIGAPLALELPTPMRRGKWTSADTSNENAKDDSGDESDSSGSDGSGSGSRGKECQNCSRDRLSRRRTPEYQRRQQLKRRQEPGNQSVRGHDASTTKRDHRANDDGKRSNPSTAKEKGWGERSKGRGPHQRTCPDVSADQDPARARANATDPTRALEPGNPTTGAGAQQQSRGSSSSAIAFAAQAISLTAGVTLQQAYEVLHVLYGDMLAATQRTS
jgi:hypothetical protein